MTYTQTPISEALQDIPFQDEIAQAASLMSIELMEPEVVAIAGMVRHTNPTEISEADLRFRIITAHQKLIDRQPVEERHLALYGVFHTLRRLVTAQEES